MSRDEAAGQPPVWRGALLALTLLALALLPWLPVLIVAAGQLAAGALGCVADGFMRPGLRWGVELGGMPRETVFMAWFVQITALPMILTLMIWLGIGAWWL